MGGAVSPQSESGERKALTGEGTAGNPYKIATAEELWDFAELVNGGKTDASAILTADIDLNNQLWDPIGSDSRRYSGTFNGDGHTISGLYIKNTSSDTDYQGLFGYVSGTVKDLSVSGSVSGSVSSDDSLSGSPVGGVVGWNFGGTVTGCAFSGSVKGSGPDSGRIYVGGVVGYNSFGTVTNCYNTGNVSVTSSDISNVGGVVGYNHGGRVENCYNTGDVTGGSYVGGVVGQNSDGTSVSASVTNCYNTGEVSGNSNVGGVVGDNGGTVTDCYFLQQGELPGIGGGSAEGVKSLTADQFKKQNSFPDWDFGTADTYTWSIHPVLGRPVLNENLEGGLGTDKSPYEISTADELENFRNLVNNGIEKSAHAKLMNDINLNGNAANQWIPIGNSIGNSYSGTFNGNGHTISGLYIYPGDNDQGLFGRVSGTVQNLSVSGSIAGDKNVGGVVGYNSGTFENCAFTGSVSGDWYVGGVVGWNDSGTVKNCYNIGDVSGNSYVGGVVGWNRSSVINCYNTGSVSDGTYTGGVVGYNISSTVTGCYFLKGTAESGIGKNVGSGDATATEKDRATFHSGEVAWRLQNGQIAGAGEPIPLVWGQSNLTTDKSWPTLIALDNSAQPVYKVTFDYGASFTDNDKHYAYSYTNGVVSEPTKNPELAGHTLSGWYSDPSLTTAWTFDTEISNDTTLYAKWTPVAEPDPDPEPTPEPEPEEPPYTGKYSYELSTSVGDHGSLTVDRYATEGEKVTIDVTPDQAYKLDELVVTANGKDVELTANSDGTYTFTMPSADVKITATFAEDPDWTEPEEPATDVSDLFIDIAPNAWYKDAVQYAYDNGLMTGVSATEFAPEATTTRAMIVSILARLENVTTAEAAGFADVTDEWYATAVNWAANVGVVNGYEDNTFKPNTAITREQLAAILMNYAAYKGYDVSARADLSHYSDADSISSWANDVLLWAVAEGLLTGVTDDTIAPQAHATRAQVAAILQRFLSE